MIKFKKLYADARIPSRAREGDAGFDLHVYDMSYSNDLAAHEGIMNIHTGVACAIPPGYVGLLFMRSSVCTKSQRLTNAVGIIDSGYRGEIIMKMSFSQAGSGYPMYAMGEKCGQLVVVPFMSDSCEVNELDETDRGAGGFGHTGV